MRRHDREILALALPALGALAADPLVSLIDTAFVGRLGAAELGALGVVAAVFAVSFFLFNFLAFATTPLVANAVGRGDREDAGRTVVGALMVAVVAGLAALTVLEAAAGPILRAMGAEGDVVDPARTYLRIRALAAPAVLVVLAAHGAFRGYQDTRTPLYVTLALNGINLVLDPVLIFGAGLGMAGAAWATVTAQWLGAGAFLWLLLVRRRHLLGISLVLPPRRRLVAFLAVGRDLVIRTAALLTTLTLATAVAARVSTTAVAAHQVAAQVWIFLSLVLDALAIAAQALVARYLGESEPGAARAVANRTLGWGLGVGVAVGAGLAAVASLVPGLFTDDPTVADAIEGVYWFVVVMQPLNAVVFVWDGIVMGATDFRYLAGAMVLSAAAGAAVLTLVLPMEWGLTGVWWGITTLMLTRGATLAWWQWRRPMFRPRPAAAR